MKKVLLTIISVCLIAASIFGLFAGVSSFSDIMNVKEYKEKDAEELKNNMDIDKNLIEKATYPMCST